VKAPTYYAVRVLSLLYWILY